MDNPMTVNDFFGDADYADVEVRDFNPDQYRLGAGKHRVEVSKAETIEKKDGTTAFIVEYSDAEGKTYTHWLNAIEAGDEAKFPGKGDTSLKDIKRAERVRILEQLGVARDKIPTFRPDDVIGVAGYLTLYKKGEYMRYGKFEPLTKTLTSSPSNGNSEFVDPNRVTVDPGETKAFGF
jgi:hypothetical protein